MIKSIMDLNTISNEMNFRLLKNFHMLSLKLDESVNKKGKLLGHWEALAEKRLKCVKK